MRTTEPETIQRAARREPPGGRWRWPRRRGLAIAAALAAAALWPSGEAAAQTCTSLDDPCQNHRPSISITPNGGTWLDDTSLSVTINWHDDRTLNATSRWIKVNGTLVTGSFNYDGAYAFAKSSSGTITLASSGTTTLEAHICDSDGLCDDASAVYTYGGSSTAPYIPAYVGLDPQHQGVRVVSPAEVTAGYSTPAYVSQDAPRSVSLAYTSGQATGQAFVQVDAYSASSVHPTRMSIVVRDAATSAVVAEGYYLWRDGYNRLAASWTAAGSGSTAKTYDVVVRSHWDVSRGAPKDTTVETPAKQVRVIILDERASPFGAGWSMVGLQRLYRPTGGMLITQGDGSAVFFANGINGLEAPRGEFSTLREDTGLGVVIRAYTDSSKAVFTGFNGLLQYVEDRFGRRTTYGYDIYNPLTTISDPVGKVTTLTYNGPNNYPHSNKLASIVDPGGRTTYFGYWDGWNNLTAIQDPAGGAAVAATYQNPGNILKTLSGRTGGVTGFAYDAAGMLAADTLPQVVANGTVQRPVIRMRSWELASLGGTSSAPAVAIRPDTLHMDLTDARGYTTRTLLDAYRQPILVVGPMNDTTGYVRNADGQVEMVTSPSGGTTTYEWDAGRVAGTYESDPETFTNTEPDPLTGEPLVKTTAGLVVNNRFGSHGELLRTWVGYDSTKATVYTYAPDGSYRVASITDPQGHQATFTYQTTGFRNLASVSRPDGDGNPQVTSFTYDAYGRGASVTDADGTSSTTYDLLNRISRSVSARGDTTLTTVSGADTATTVTDAAHKTYTFNRNRLGWLLSETDPNGRTQSQAYDLGGNATSRTDRNSHTVTVTYDTLSRMRTRTANSVTTTFSYGRPRDPWVAAVSPATNDTIRFDRRGRPVVEVSVIGGTRYARTSYFRPEGVRDSLEYTTPAGTRKVRFRYDTQLRLLTLTGPGGTADSTHLTYNTEGQATAVRLPSGLVQGLDYLPSHALAAQGWSAGTVDAAFHRDWSYDAQGRVASRMNVNKRREYLYDAISQLVGKTDLTSSLGPLQCDEPGVPTSCHRDTVWTEDSTATYGYDRVHNRTDNGATLQTTSNRYATFGGYTLGYDYEGNLTSKTKSGYSQTYTWDDLGQLASVTTNGTTVSYTYSGFGDRVKRTQGSAVTWSVYDGDDLLLEADGSGNVLREYTMYPGVDAPHSVRVWSGATAGAANFYMMEQPGHVAGVVNGSSQVVDQYRYTPWGQAESTTETVAQPLRFMAREYDATTGLYYVRARWYDPALARFNSEDPIGLDGGINQYAYVGNSATNLRDPSGLDPYCYVANKATVTVGPGTANGEYWTGAVITDSGPYIKCVETSGSSPSPSTRGSNWDRGGGAPGSTDPMFVDIERRHQQGAQCLIKVGLAALNVVGDVFAVGGILKAVAGAERAAPALGRAWAYSLYRGDFAAAVKPGLFPVSTNVGGATAFGVAGMNGKDLLLFGLGFVPIVGSGLSIYDAYETCSGHAK